jgi:hypothetical protein
MVVKETLVNRTKFLYIKRSVVNASRGTSRCFPVIDQIPEGGEEIAVGDQIVVQGDASKKLAVQHGKAQKGSQGLSSGLGCVVRKEFPEDAKT